MKLKQSSSPGVLFRLKLSSFKTLSKLFWNCFVSVSFRFADSFTRQFSCFLCVRRSEGNADAVTRWSCREVHHQSVNLSTVVHSIWSLDVSCGRSIFKAQRIAYTPLTLRVHTRTAATGETLHWQGDILAGWQWRPSVYDSYHRHAGGILCCGKLM